MDPVTRRMVNQAQEKLRHAAERTVALREPIEGALIQEDLPFAEFRNAAADDHIRLPSRAYRGDAGFDLFVSENRIVEPGLFVDIHCHIAVELPEGVWALIIGRSSTLRKRGLMVNPGIIDTGYRGELFTGVWNMGPAPVEVEVGERLAQLILFLNVTERFQPVWALGDLAPSDRGAQGFGSSGQ